jgi:hypothetical protein
MSEEETRKIIIEKGVPIPPKYGVSTVGRNGSYAVLLQMEPGDSVFFEGLKSQEAYHKVYYAVNYHHKKKWKLETRDVCDGARVWRTK